MRYRVATGTLVAGLLAISLFSGAAAQEADSKKRFEVDGDRLIYDSSVPVDGEDRDISYGDVARMRDLLRAAPDIRTLELNSTGGGHYSAMELSALAIDFELDTHVVETCESSCVSVFLAGTNRTLARGARLGFHQLTWTARSVEEYYDKHRKRRGWDSPFDFAEWMYEDTQTETYIRLAYMVSRGVDPGFAIQSIRKPDTSMWFPPRAVLLASGVLTQ